MANDTSTTTQGKTWSYLIMANKQNRVLAYLASIASQLIVRLYAQVSSFKFAYHN